MSISVALKALLIWLLILVLAVVNGGLREVVFNPILGTTTSLVLSGILLSAVILILAYWMLPWMSPQVANTYLYIGGAWLISTVAFEFAFGLWQGDSLRSLLEAYTFKNGNIWPIVLVVTLFAPWIGAKMRRYI
ncbi:hypothetical protein ST37_06455 [Vibrio sp. qd031]|uniref:hypothetical protein n=1 Tax=Vibrio sp. qd031 TaxID=1603038 RepID=UPI000A10B46C|nr:hypothetical protein [Vibrio sp. qd031]ORT51020.1 hypothetical protein ST37_06455 [Vibrio sp. qd031]